ncbi:MAG: hypothetical protein IPL61_13505 [Myxococcales bacterium]|nr:hypothetical protein [Myxococcales bacterium]
MAADLIVLGSQHATPDVGAVVRARGLRGPVAMVRAGYQEREADDAALVEALGVPAVNLALHARAGAVFADDPAFTAAYQARQSLLRHMQSCYRVRLEKTEDAARTIALRYFEPELLEGEDAVSVDQFRQLDDNHLIRCGQVRTAFAALWHPTERPVVARHRAELAALLAPVEAVVIAGGHVASLHNRLELFDLLGLAAGKLLIAWGAGAMVLTDRIVLYHDYPPYGSDIAQLLDAGLGRAPGVVVMPDPSRRLRPDTGPAIARFARRMAPALCVGMDLGAELEFEGGALIGGHGGLLRADGVVDPAWTHRRPDPWAEAASDSIDEVPQ